MPITILHVGSVLMVDWLRANGDSIFEGSRRFADPLDTKKRKGRPV
jgi:hypothetical protein